MSSEVKKILLELDAMPRFVAMDRLLGLGGTWDCVWNALHKDSFPLMKLNGDGDGDGYGSGTGYGYGSGDGYGSGTGYGYGSGDGSGDGKKVELSFLNIGGGEVNTGDYVLVRSRNDGVKFGKYISHSGQEVWLEDAQQIWSWDSSEFRLTLLDVACIPGDVTVSQKSVAPIVMLETCGIIPVTDAVRDRILSTTPNKRG